MQTVTKRHIIVAHFKYHVKRRFAVTPESKLAAIGSVFHPAFLYIRQRIAVGYSLAGSIAYQTERTGEVAHIGAQSERRRLDKPSAVIAHSILRSPVSVSDGHDCLSVGAAHLLRRCKRYHRKRDGRQYQP